MRISRTSARPPFFTWVTQSPFQILLRYILRECYSNLIQLTQEELKEWKRLIPEKMPYRLPPWVFPDAELLWKRRAFSAGKEWVDQVPIRVSQVRPTQGWFSTYNIEDGQLWFWSARTLFEEGDLSPMGGFTRFFREDVV